MNPAGIPQIGTTMTTLFRVRTTLNGFIGAPGVATMYFLDVATAHNALHDLWTAFAARMPSDVRIQVVGGADQIEDTTGDLTGSVPTAQPDLIEGTDPLAYAAPVGLLGQWQTSAVVGGHRVRGRTFIVPAGGRYFNSAGQAQPADLVAVQTAMSAFIVSQSSSFVIWSRPFAGTPATVGHPSRPARLGSNHLVTGASVSTRAVVLRSRRD